MSQKIFQVKDEAPTDVGFFAELDQTFKATPDDIERGYLRKVEKLLKEKEKTDEKRR